MILSKFKRMGVGANCGGKGTENSCGECLRELLSAVAELKSTAKTIFASYAVARPLRKSGCCDTD